MQEKMDNLERPADFIKFRDYFEIINSVIFVGLGSIIIFQSFRKGLGAMAFFMGILFLSFGIYRIKHIFDYFYKRKR